MSSISIIGCGWLGLPLARRCLACFEEVKGSSTHEQKLPHLKSSGIKPYVLDYHPRCLQPIGDFYRSDILFINIPFRRQLPDPNFYFEQIRSVCEDAQKGSIKRIIFASSTSVYPESNPWASEDEVFLPDNERSSALKKTEDFVLNACKDATIIRFGGLVGGSREIGKILAGKSGLSDAQKPVNLIHLDDCLGVVMKIIEGSYPGEIFNAVCDQHPTRESLYIKRAKMLAVEPPQFGPSVSSGVYKVVSNAKVKERLGYAFRYPDPMMFPT